MSAKSDGKTEPLLHSESKCQGSCGVTMERISVSMKVEDSDDQVENSKVTVDIDSQYQLDSPCGNDIDDDFSDYSGNFSSVYSQCKSTNLSIRERLQSETDMAFGTSDFDDFLHESGGSFDAFVDALDFDFNSDSESQNRRILDSCNDMESLDWFVHSPVGSKSEIKGTGRPDLCNDEELELEENQVDEASTSYSDSMPMGEKHILPNTKHNCNFSMTNECSQSGSHNPGLNEPHSKVSMDQKQYQSQDLTYAQYSSADHLVGGSPAHYCMSNEDGSNNSGPKFKTIEESLGPQTVEENNFIEAFCHEKSVLADNSSPVLNPLETADTSENGAVIGTPKHHDLMNREHISHSESREAQQLLTLDLSNIRKPQYPLYKEASNEHSIENGTMTIDWAQEYLGPDELSRYVEALEVKESYIDTVWDMEDVLLDVDNSNGHHYFWGAKSPLTPCRLTRDGSSSASATSEVRYREGHSVLSSVDSVEVVGARQKKGGASLGGRMVGVREHTVYRIKVRYEDKEWEVERRYRDFVNLYQQLKQMFGVNYAQFLPDIWRKVGIESRKVFGNTSPDIVEVRSALLQVCLQSALQAGPPLSAASPLLQFLSPSGTSNAPAYPSKLTSNEQKQLYLQLKELHDPSSPQAGFNVNSSNILSQPVVQDSRANQSPFGKTIRLNIRLLPKTSFMQQLFIQHYSCAGCYRDLELPTSMVSSFVKSLGWGKPRLCEYSGQLFCSSCHLNETAIIPARVLHLWDFSPRPVSQLAKAYLDSIYNQPMLCVSAVNPFLYTRVPLLAHVGAFRKKLSKMIDCMHCPSRAWVRKMVGSRTYLLEDNDFFALRDLGDISKGAFAILPGLLRTVYEKLCVHITQKCSLCHEVGEICHAEALCDYPLKLIYPFEDKNVHRCSFCHLAFHKACFSKYSSCPSCNKDNPMLPSEEDNKRSESESISSTAASMDSLLSQHGPREVSKYKKYFSGLLGSRESTCVQTSSLNMSALLGRLDL